MYHPIRNTTFTSTKRLPLRLFFLFISLCFLVFPLTAREKKEEKEFLKITTETLFVRATPSSTAKKLQMLAKGAVVISLKQKEQNGDITWIRIECKGKDDKIIGWVAEQYTTITKKEKAPGIPTHIHDYPAVKKNHNFPNNPPVEVRGIYLTMFSAMKGRLRSFFKRIQGSEINAFVIDIKNTNGRLLYRDPKIKEFLPQAYKKAIYSDISYLKEWLAPRQIYRIARIPVFKDDLYAKTYPNEAIKDAKTGEIFKDRDKLLWVSPCSRRYWDYILTICEGAADAGFNEIQFDYVRLPDVNDELSWGKCGTRREIIREFLLYATKRLHKKKVFVSADVFGLVSSVRGDMHIGQYWEAMSSVVDYMSPMAYPSHYAPGYAGVAIPDANPEKVISVSLFDAKKRNKNIAIPAKIRPWIQDFTAFWIKGHIEYGEAEVTIQIEALKALGIHEYILWNPKNRYHLKSKK